MMAYDGAAVMSGQHSGVQAMIKEQTKVASYIYRSAHCLRLVLVDVVNSAPDTEEVYSILQSLNILPLPNICIQNGCFSSEKCMAKQESYII